MKEEVERMQEFGRLYEMPNWCFGCVRKLTLLRQMFILEYDYF